VEPAVEVAGAAAEAAVEVEREELAEVVVGVEWEAVEGAAEQEEVEEEVDLEEIEGEGRWFLIVRGSRRRERGNFLYRKPLKCNC
jgi:hypothetical protein